MTRSYVATMLQQWLEEHRAYNVTAVEILDYIESLSQEENKSQLNLV